MPSMPAMTAISILRWEARVHAVAFRPPLCRVLNIGTNLDGAELPTRNGPMSAPVSGSLGEPAAVPHPAGRGSAAFVPLRKGYST
jgi:hypothetical protein